MRVATIIDPEGGRHACNEVQSWDSRVPSMFWCAGLVDRSPEALADRLHAAWFAPGSPTDRTYERQEASFGDWWNP